MAYLSYMVHFKSIRELNATARPQNSKQRKWLWVRWPTGKSHLDARLFV